MYKFSEAKPYMIAHVIREINEDEVYREYELGKNMARGYDLHLSCLDPKLKNEETLTRIFKAAPLPTLCLNYGIGMDFKGIGVDRDILMDQLYMSACCGAHAVDLQGFTYGTAIKDYDPKFLFTKSKPHEVIVDEKAIVKQMDFIDKIHKMDKEVLISTHTGVYMHTDEVVSLAKWIEQRHPDIVKIVTAGCDTAEQVIETLETVRVLNEEMKCKFSLHCNGKMGYLTRLLDPVFGSYMAFSVRDPLPQYDPHQLRLSEISELVNSNIWKTIFEEEAADSNK